MGSPECPSDRQMTDYMFDSITTAPCHSLLHKQHSTMWFEITLVNMRNALLQNNKLVTLDIHLYAMYGMYKQMLTRI